jgi:hypothetical protein
LSSASTLLEKRCTRQRGKTRRAACVVVRSSERQLVLEIIKGFVDGEAIGDEGASKA